MAIPTTQLATIPFGTRDEVKEMQERLVLMLPQILPNAAALSEPEARALAQVALAHGLSPFNSEIYFIPKLGVYPGIRGYRKAARRQMRRDGGDYWLSEPKFASATDYGGEAGDFCCVYELRDSVTMGRYLDLRSKIFDMNRMPQDILKMAKEDNAALTSLKDTIERTSLSILGHPPITIGVGIVKKFEAEGRIKKAGLSVVHIAKIRAERAALRVRFDLDLVFGNNEEAWQHAEAIDATIEDVEEAPSEKSPMEQLGFERPTTPVSTEPVYHTSTIREWNAEQVKAVIGAGYAKNDFAAKGMLGLSELTADATPEQCVEWAMLYRLQRPIGHEKESVSSQEAAEIANKEWSK